MPNPRTLTDAEAYALNENYDALYRLMQQDRMLTPSEAVAVRASLALLKDAGWPETLLTAKARLAAEWTDLVDKLEHPFDRGLHDMRGLHIPVREASAILWRWCLIVGGASFAITTLALLYAIAAGQFDWSAG